MEVAVVKDGEAMAEGVEVSDAAGGEEDGLALSCLGGEEGFEFGAFGGCEVGEGGVEEEEVGFFDEGVGELGAEVGVGGEGFAGALGEKGIEPDAGGGAGGRVGVWLADVADAGLIGAGVGWLAEDADGAFGGAEDSGEELEDGGFARAGGADEAVDFCGVEVEGELVECASVVIVESERDVAELCGWRHRRDGSLVQERGRVSAWKTEMERGGRVNSAE